MAVMSKALALVALLGVQAATVPFTHPDIAVGPESFSTRVVAAGLQNPWDLNWAPDGQLWVTERVGKRVTIVNPTSGTQTVAATVPDVMQTHAQDGLLGLVFGPDFLAGGGPDHVYVALTYDADPGPAASRQLMIRRYTYTRSTGTLASPMDIVTGLPAGADHISARLVLGHDRKLFLTIGDQGSNQLSLWCQPMRAHILPTAAEIASGDWRAYQGKVLRVNLDGSIPTDNPLFGGVRSHVFSTGHRNAQGIVIARDGQIYGSEHGPAMDDEVNLIQAGKDYGWPFVAGYRDDRVYTYNNWSESKPEPCNTLKFTEPRAPASVPQQKETAWNGPNFMPPIRTFFTIGDDHNFQTMGNATIAPSGMDVYSVPSGGIPGWSDSLLVTSLIRGAVYRVKLTPGGASTTGPSLEYFKARRRYRDVLVGPDGRTIYAIADGGSQDNPHSIVAFTFAP
jgi:PQQ-dependent dehydrogenase (s-GDH family)